MPLLRKLIVLALITEAGWAAIEWWTQVNAVAAWLSAPSQVVAMANPSRPMMASMGSLSVPVAPPSARAEAAPMMNRQVSSFIPEPTGLSVLPPTAGQAEEIAKRYLEEHREAWQIRQYHDFRAQVTVTPVGTSVVFTTQQDGMDLEGLTIDISLSNDLKVTQVGNLYQPVPRAETSGNFVDPREALEKVSSHYVAAGDIDSPKHVLTMSNPKLQPELTYWLPIKDRASGRITKGLFRASDGSFLREQLSF